MCDAREWHRDINQTIRSQESFMTDTTKSAAAAPAAAPSASPSHLAVSGNLLAAPVLHGRTLNVEEFDGEA